MVTDRGAAVVLLSGGLDSVTVLAMARAARARVYALSFSYGQRHGVELECARRQAQRLGAAAHEIVDLTHFGGLVAKATALVESSHLAVPKTESGGVTKNSAIPLTYVPARNALFLTYALAWAEVLGARDIWLGVNALDYSGYPDCRPEFIAAFGRMAALATRRGVEGNPIGIQAPLQHLEKREIIAAGVKLGVDYADTVSCYDPMLGEQSPIACGRCESCTLRRRGFAGAGVPDPTRYA